MSFKVRSSIVIKCAPEQLWRYLDDCAHDHEWRPTLKTLRRVANGHDGAGTTYEGVVRVAGRDYPYVNEVTLYAPPSRIAWRSLRASGWIEGREGSYTLEPTPDGTRFTLELKGEPISRLGALLERPLSVMFQTVGIPQLVRDLKSAAERSLDRA